MDTPLTGHDVARSLSEAHEIWMCLDIAYGLASADAPLLADITAFLAPRLRLPPHAFDVITTDTNNHRDPQLRNTALTVMSTMSTVPEVNDEWAIDGTGNIYRAAHQHGRAITDYPNQRVNESTALLLIGARVVNRGGQQQVVLVGSRPRHALVGRLHDGDAIGLHHVVAIMARHGKIDASEAWDRTERARVASGLDFFGPSPEECQYGFDMFLSGSDGARF